MTVGGAYQLGHQGSGDWWIQGENDFEFCGEVYRPDAIGWRKSRLPRLAKHRATVVPDWICEVLSPSTRRHDLKTKAAAYARIGVCYRWYVDPDVRTLHAFELKRGRWVECGVFCETDTVCAKPFEGVALSMADWWGGKGQTSSPKMTGRQQEFLAFIHEYGKIHGRSPSESEICRYFGLTPPSVHSAIVRMEKAGLIARSAGQARSIRILVAEPDIPKLENRKRSKT